MTRFAHAVREELWLRGRRLESRLSFGEAVEDEAGIVATDTRDDALVDAASLELQLLRAAVPLDALVRIVAEARDGEVTGTMTVRIGTLSVVTTREHVLEDVALLRASQTIGMTQRHDPNEVALVWRNGSAAVLLHEAFGHPLEHDHAPLVLPEWLAADIPLRSRRATFRDVPLLRMDHVHVTQSGAPFDLPAQRIDVHLVEGGAYEPLTETVTMTIAASSIGPFSFSRRRDEIVFAGASGDPVRYPGVICSREGQELVVGSSAPDVVTRFR